MNTLIKNSSFLPLNLFLRVFLLLPLLLCFPIARAQDPLFQKFTREHGLPSNHVYQCLQDNDGFIWLATQNGVSRFDGEEFINYDLSNGFIDQGAFHMHLDKQGRIWFLTFSGKVCYFQNNLFHQLNHIKHSSLQFIKSIAEDSRGNISLGSWEGIFLLLSPDLQCKKIIKYPRHLKLVNHAFLNDSCLIFQILWNYYVRLNVNTARYDSILVPGTTLDYPRFFHINNEFLITGNDGIYRITDKQCVKIISREAVDNSPIVICCEYDKLRKKILVGTGKGLFEIDPESNYTVSARYFPTYSVSSCCIDRNNKYWISLLYEGLFFMQSKDFLHITAPEKYRGYNNFKHLVPTARKLYTSNQRGDLFEINHDTLHLKYELNSKGGLSFFHGIQPANDTTLWAFINGMSYEITPSGKRLGFLDYVTGAALVWYRAPYGLFSYIGDELHKVNPQKHKSDTIYRCKATPNLMAISPKCLAVDKKYNYWVGNKDGLHYVENTRCFYLSDSFPELKIFIPSILLDENECLWIATSGRGLYCMKNNRIIKHFTTHDGLLDDNIKKIILHHNRLWCVTAKGVTKLENYQTRQPVISTYNQNKLLPATEISDIAAFNDRIYFSTGLGIISFPESARLFNYAQAVYMTNVFIAGQKENLRKSYTIPYGQSIRLDYTTPDLYQTSGRKYRYRMMGLEPNWFSTDKKNITFSSLPPGKYTFEIMVDGLQPVHPLSIQLNITPNFWQTYTFRILMGILVGCIATLITYYFTRNANRRYQLERQLAVTQLNALRAQINPHFVFNSLNSIQSFILEQQPRLANNYLSKFAMLMRMIVENSKRELISLKDETDFLALYLGLEKLRFNDELQFDIELSPELDAEQISIPPMIIQPMVENAIKHGLSAKKGERNLSLIFKKENQFLHCIITDNGIGRKRAAELAKQQSGKRSAVGIQNVRERLNLFYKGQKDKLPAEWLTITDLEDKNDAKMTGTQIDILFPIQ